MPQSDTTFSYIGSSGEMETYQDSYGAVTQDDIDSAERLERYILDTQTNIEQSFLKMGAALVVFEEERYYLARGMPSMRAWLNSPEFHISYRLAMDLMRIARELVPLFPDDTVPELPVSTMRELLPLVSEGRTAEEIVGVAEDIQGMTVRDARNHIREVRGIDEPEQPTIFRARVEMGEEYHRVWITRYGDDGDIYQLSREPLRIKPRDWQRWSTRFGGFINYEQAE